MSTKQVDNGLENYYRHKKVPYKNDEDIGKFEQWADENGYDTDTMREDFQANPEDTSIVEFDDEFPTDKTDEDKVAFIFKILTHCWNTPNAFKDSDKIPDKNKRSNGFISSSNSFDDLQVAQAMSASLADANKNKHTSSMANGYNNSNNNGNSSTSDYYNGGSMYGPSNKSSLNGSSKNDGWDHGNTIVGDFWKQTSKPKNKYNINYFDENGNPKKFKV